ncbi:hypothetical protein [Breoghania sp. L-A4]|uniref:hypothetical protein n=1 Tax=Breoghania sp. L-A4 TaxID=2304600 RepID=UPI0020C10021|nr:hypothetical protein [Breoghania sp. L-A4]
MRTSPLLSSALMVVDRLKPVPPEMMLAMKEEKEAAVPAGPSGSPPILADPPLPEAFH